MTKRRPTLRSLGEFDLIGRIADRAVALYAMHDIKAKRLDVVMDLYFCHGTVPLRLEELLAADDADFAHDIAGINRHLNRETHELGDCFMPRYAAGAPA